VPQDYAGLIALVRANPRLISDAWREKIESVTPEQVDADFLRRFVQENRALFASPEPAAPAAASQAAPPAEGGQPAAASPGPSTWPTPANE
jgi:hypothetical protein